MWVFTKNTVKFILEGGKQERSKYGSRTKTKPKKLQYLAQYAKTNMMSILSLSPTNQVSCASQVSLV